MFERYGIDDRNIYKICVVATMSSGKSTFINSIIGDEILPEKNEACTARTMSVLDNDNADIKKAHIIRNNGAKEIVEISGREVLEQINNDADIIDFLVETNIKSIKNTDKAVVLVDTPGVNNSEDEEHGKRTSEFLKQMDEGLIIYLMNATQLATNDDEILLKSTLDYVEKQNGKVKIIFVLNKIDALDTETESIREIVGAAASYIKTHGFENPVIYPLSALSAKLLRMAYYRRTMTRREQRRLEDVFQNYRPSENNMLSYARLNSESADIYQIGDESVSGQEIQRAIANTGITAIETCIAEHMQSENEEYTPEILIRATMDESLEEQYHARLCGIPEGRAEINLSASEKLKEMLENSIELQRLLNRKTTSNVCFFQNHDNEEIIHRQAGDLIEDIELTKNEIMKLAVQNSVCEIPSRQNCFYIYEDNDKKKVRVSTLYLMSFDRLNWKKISFVQLSEEISTETEVFLYNVYTNFLYEINKENIESTIVILDSKFPAGIISIPGFHRNGIVPYSDIAEYIQDLKETENKKRQEDESVREQLERTYKGIVFHSVEEKDAIIQKENKYKGYCKYIEQKNYRELLQLKVEITDELPEILARPMLYKILEAMERQENIERNAHVEWIKEADLEKAESFQENLKYFSYSPDTMERLRTDVRQRILACQRENLEQCINDINNMDRVQLRQAEEKIMEFHYNAELTEKYVSKVRHRYDIVETEEISVLCKDIDEKNIPQLEALSHQLESEYREEFTEKYRNNIARRIEFLHIRHMDELCGNAANEDKEGLRRLRNLIDAEQCKKELKSEYYEKINRRWEQLDYEEMNQLTENISDKSSEELSAIYTKLKNWECDIKLKRPFLQKVRINLDYTWYKQLDKLTEDLGEKNRDEINSVAKQIKEKSFPDRIRKNAEDKVDGKSFELDMRELIGLGNDFNHFDRNAVDLLEQKAILLNVSDRSRDIYREKLKERRYCIGLSEVSREVQLFSQLCEKYGTTLQNLKTVMNTSDYRTCADRFCSRYNISGYSEIPVFMMQEKSEIAVTADSLFYTVGNEHYKAPFDIVFSIGISKKLLSDKLIISFKNGTDVELATPLNKKEQEKFANLMNEFLNVIKNSTVILSYPILLYHTENLNLKNFIYDENKYWLDKETIADIFLQSYMVDKKRLGFGFYACGRRDDKWSQLEEKVRKNFAISADNILWIYDGTILRSGKEGMAIGENMIYLKKGTQNTVNIPMDKIFAVETIGEKRGIAFKTVDDYTFICEMTELREEMQETFVNMIWEYIQGIQLVNKINSQSVPIIKNSSASSPRIAPKFCINCGAPLGEHAKFCTRCGKKIELLI